MGSNVIANPKRRFPADIQRRHDELMHRHKHNSAYGSTILAMRHLENFQTLNSATPRAQELAKAIHAQMAELAIELYTQRVELDGKTVTPKHGIADGSQGPADFSRLQKLR